MTLLGHRTIQFKFELNLPHASSHDETATANEVTSVELLAMFNRVFVSTSERCCEEVNITERS